MFLDKISSTPSSATSVSSGIPLTTSTAKENAETSTITTTTTAKGTETVSMVTTKEMSTESTKTESTLSTANLLTTTTTHPVFSTSSQSTIANGTWSNWGPWTMCAVTCGNSFHSRYRTCIKNTVNDTNCVGNFKQQEECTTTACPVYGTWTTWQSWSNCDVTCSGGTQTRSRICMKVSNTDIDCVGRTVQQQTCSDWACPDCSKVCINGTLNSECDACECLSYIYGLVRNSNGGLLNNVSIAIESAPYRQLTTTNENGTFELNNVCNEQHFILKRLGYQDKTVKILSSPVFLSMDLIQYPVITTQPKSHLSIENALFVQQRQKLIGDLTSKTIKNDQGFLSDRKILLIFYGIDVLKHSSAITQKTSQLKNGNLLNESFYPGGSSLILTDLKFADSGNVVCRANSPAGAIFSDSVYLSVRANPDDFCSDAYETYEVNLPSDCIQADTNSIRYDIGKCSPKLCKKNNSNVEELCSVDKRFCCSPSKREKRIIQCTGYSFPLYVTTSCSCGECEDIDIRIYGQAVGATSGLPLRFGTIELEGNSVGSTGIVGDFSFTVPRGTTRIAVKFKDTIFNQFLDTLKIIRLNEELFGSFNIHVSMIEKSTPIDISSNVSNTLQIGDQDSSKSIASLTIPPNSIFYSNGTQYNGAAKASLNFFDPRNSSSIENAPGEFVSINLEGQTQNLQTFGVLSLALQDSSGSNLQLTGETEIKLDQSFFESTSIGNVSDAKLWGLNPETGIWEEQGTLSVITSKRKKRQTSFLVGTIQISAYEWWNFDVPFDSEKCYFKSEVFEGTEQLSRFTVRVIYLTNTASNSIVKFRETPILSNTPELARCRKDTPLKSYIEVEKDGKKIPVDLTNSGLSASAESFIGYQVMEDGRAVSGDVRLSESGPFYSSSDASFQNTFRFKLESNDYSLKVLNPDMQEAIQYHHPGNEVWYPPLNSLLQGEIQYRTCFIKIGTVNANTNLLFRVISINDDSSILGIHEKGLINGSTCIEYRCSVQNPDFTRVEGNDFYRYPETYTKIRVIPIGQVCSVSSESSQLRANEQANLGLSSPRSNTGNTFFEANIPDNEYEGIFFHKSYSFNDMSVARKSAIKECNKGEHDSFSTVMSPNVGLALTFSCL
ncbi:hypothetical protein KUTeg_015739 [Tegillarca granosa]|uniref:Uncharacterized protein n=1 Tax=Tegillarca granosa TaxID=220873 RepID=A0ABQ9EN78_TEGGR|nr:hypothetical protein KUTeg_015739 [Tegillarca granosa]